MTGGTDRAADRGEGLGRAAAGDLGRGGEDDRGLDGVLMRAAARERTSSPQDAERRRRRRRRRTAVGAAVLVVGALVVAGVVWGAVALLSLQRHASATADDAAQVRRALADGDVDGALDGTRAAARQASAAHDASSALPLALAAHLPGQLGRTVTAVRTVTAATDTALSRGALPLLRVARTVETTHSVLRPDGSVDVEVLQAQSARVQPAAAALRTASSDLSSVHPATLPSSLRPKIVQAEDGITDLSRRASAAGGALAVLPSALGADGPRTYLVVFQNTAEVRPTGGIAGTWAQLTLDDGRPRLTQTGSDADLATITGPLPDLGAQFRANYPADEVSVIQNANLSPHFPYAARIYAALWAQDGRPRVDGVIAADPTGMASLLTGAGTIPVAGGPSISADDVVDVMLRQVYLDFATDNEARKDYLNAVVGAAFEHALSGGGLNASSVRSLVSAAQGHHVMAWSAHADEERDLVRAGVAGWLPRPTRRSAGVFLTNTSGVYLTNTAASKLDYYVHEAVTTTGGCAGAPAVMSVALRNDAPEQVPAYVSNKVDGLPLTSESLLVAFYVPPTRGVSSVTVDGKQVPFSAGTERGWSLVRLGVVLPRATTTTVDVTFSGAGTPVQHVLTGPMVNTPSVRTDTRCSG